MKTYTDDILQRTHCATQRSFHWDRQEGNRKIDLNFNVIVFGLEAYKSWLTTLSVTSVVVESFIKFFQFKLPSEAVFTRDVIIIKTVGTGSV